MDTVCHVDVEVIRVGQISANRTLRTCFSTSLRVIFRAALSSPESSDESVTEGIADGQVTVTTSTAGDWPWREAKLSDLLGYARHIRFHLDKDKSTLHFIHLAQAAALAASHSPTYTDNFKRPGDAAATWGTKPAGTLHDFHDLPSTGNLDQFLMYERLRNRREGENILERVRRLRNTTGAPYLPYSSLYSKDPLLSSQPIQDPRTFQGRQGIPEQISETPSHRDPRKFQGRQGTPEQIHAPPPVVSCPTLSRPTISTDRLGLSEDKGSKPLNSTDPVAPTGLQAALGELLLGIAFLIGLRWLLKKYVGTGKGQVPPGRVYACSFIILVVVVVVVFIYRSSKGK